MSNDAAGATEPHGPAAEHPVPASEAAVPDTQVTARSGDAVLEAVHLTKHFPLGGIRNKGVVHAVDDFNVALTPGHVVALVGESGSGKSTVARLLSRLYIQTDGEVLLHGKPVTVRRGKAFRQYTRHAQMIFQDPFASLNPVHTVRYVLTRAVKIHTPGLRGDNLEKQLRELLDRVQLSPDRYLDKFPHELSGGQRQRVVIARALAADPEVLLADEPISMLDVSIRVGILNLLQDLRDRFGIAILYITHDIASARYFADETKVMYAGRVVETGDSESTTQQPAHPYTQLLVRSAPDPENLAVLDKTGAKGEPPNMVKPPTGCRFRPRCPFATALCETTPPMFEIGPKRQVACWGYADKVEGGTDALPQDAIAQGAQIPDLGDAAATVLPLKEVAA